MAWVMLHLTSPHMRDGHGSLKGKTEVHHMQKLLTKNRFRNFEPGAIDSEYGIHSAHASQRAKFDLGYPKKRLNQWCPEDLEQYLSGKRLSKIYAFRRRRRLLARKLKRTLMPNVMTRGHAYIKTQIGYKESPFGSNRNKFGAWYGINGAPWCAICATYCVVVGGGYSRGRSFRRGVRWSYVPYIVADARSRRNGLEVVSSTYVKIGDLVCYDWNHDGTADHVEFFDGWISRGVSFWAVGGNTGPTNASNGGEVARQIRYTSTVQNYVRAMH